ncbi:16S rRNA (guanine(527)-N(7))-methyltransferase RsmG [Treponema pedis]|nr:16S rRNA (guanine(527)-N(7))-methyltransferase RsmG [Treponema pedis]
MKDILLKGFQELGIEDKEGKSSELLLLYLKEIKMFNTGFNLVKVKDDKELVISHILDSLSAYKFFNAEIQSLIKKSQTKIDIADAGSGAGFPGIPLACLFSSFSESERNSERTSPCVLFTLIERMKKRASFLQNVKAVLNLANIQVLEDEAENSPQNKFDIVTCRAFRTLDKHILHTLLNCTKQNGKLFLYKATEEKINEETELIKKENLKFKVEKLIVPFLKKERNLLIVEKKLLRITMKQKPYSVIYKDDDLLIVNKSAGLAAAADRWDETAPRLDKIICSDIFSNSGTDDKKLYTVHRIDKDTSGLIMYALNSEIHKKLSEKFQNREIEKTYHAVVAGKPPCKNFSCDAKLKIDGDKFHRTVMDNKQGKDSFTEFTVLENLNRFTLIEARPVTGRTHQIRVHLKLSGFPILCDSLYGKNEPVFLSQIKKNWRGDKYEERPLLARLALHAYALKFIHPVTEKIIEVIAEYPKDLKSLVNQLRNF